jgi:ribosomal protein L3
MDGQLGNKRITTMNLRVVDIQAENDLLLIRVPSPGEKRYRLYSQDQSREMINRQSKRPE